MGGLDQKSSGEPPLSSRPDPLRQELRRGKDEDDSLGLSTCSDLRRVDSWQCLIRMLIIERILTVPESLMVLDKKSFRRTSQLSNSSVSKEEKSKLSPNYQK